MSSWKPMFRLTALALVATVSGCGPMDAGSAEDSATVPTMDAKTRLEPELTTANNGETLSDWTVAEKAPSNPALASGKFQNGLILEILGMKVTSDSLLRVNFQVSNPTPNAIDPGLNGFGFWNNLYYVEEGGRHKAFVAKAGDEFFASKLHWRTLAPHEKAQYWVMFPLPHQGTKRISFYFDEVEPIEDVPLTSVEASSAK